MTQTVPSDPVTRIFTFGYGHTCPHTGKDLADHYVTITAPDMSAARLLMIAVFGKAWCTDYSGIDDPRLRGHGPRMVEHGRFVVGVPAPADRGMGYSRPADDPTPVGAREPLHTGAMTDGGLVDETPAEPVGLAPAPLAQHYETGAWKGDEPGSCGTDCACGVSFDGFDSLTEALAVLKRHIAEGNATPPKTGVAHDAAARARRAAVVQVAAVEAAHADALDEDNTRATKAIVADLRDGEHDRITDPNLARFLASKQDAHWESVRVAANTVPVPAEDATLTAVVEEQEREIVHMGDDSLLPICGDPPADEQLKVAFSASQITCPTCADLADALPASAE